MILAGDCGATKTTLGLWDELSVQPGFVALETYATKDFTGLTPIINKFLNSNANYSVTRACLGVPGPVVMGFCRFTNINWIVSERDLAVNFGFDFTIVNDMIIHCHSIPVLNPDDIIHIYEPPKLINEDVTLVIAPGTGLGQAFFIKSKKKINAFPSEASHRAMLPCSEEEEEFIDYLLSKQIDPVYDKVLSGGGIELMYEFFYKLQSPVSSLCPYKSPAQISHEAMTETNEDSIEAMDFFANILSTYCQEMALIFEPFGGIYLTGGICCKNYPIIEDNDSFMMDYENEIMKLLLENIPVRIVKDEFAPLKGAVNFLTHNR